MKGLRMESDWRTIQVFLDDTGVCEVQADHHNPFILKCTCKGFKFNRCQHTKHVRDTMQSNDGQYTVQINADIDPAEAAIAMESAEAFRRFIIKYGKVEVI